MRTILLLFGLSLYFKSSQGFWNLQEVFDKYVEFFQRDNEKKTGTEEPREICDENEILLQLARLYATSPERIILLSTNPLSKTCKEVSNVLKHINDSLVNCIPLSSDNLYMKLNNGLNYYNTYICENNFNVRSNHLLNYHSCLAELREDLLDCEGPPDWFEKSNKAVVCQTYSDIINCNYIKAAMLCGLKPASLLRTFSNEVMKRIVKFKCNISRSLPHIDDPMPARACRLKCYIIFFLYTYFSFNFMCICYIFLINVCNFLNIDPVSYILL